MKIQRAFLVLIAAMMLPALAQAAVLGRDGKPIIDDPNATPSGSNCFYTHAGVGCDNAACSVDVISIDSFCGSAGWDSICVNEAKELCPVDADTARATFAVQKAFADGNSTLKATAEINCFTGLPLYQSQEIKNGQVVKFIVESFDDEKLDCTVKEKALAGYTASYQKGAALISTGGYSPSSATGCEFLTVGWEQNWSCRITNTPVPVQVTVTKDWEVTGAGGDQLDPTYMLELQCSNPIGGGSKCYNNNNYCKVLTEKGTGNTNDKSYTADVVPYWDGGAKCSVVETVWDSSVEVDDTDCKDSGDITVMIGGVGGDNACTIVNTVFFEGIPTLSQYGMAIMALMMLAVGFVGFRRFV